MSDQQTSSQASGTQADLQHNVDAFENSANRLANDVNAVVQAWSQANAEAFKGAVSVLGHLAVGLNDTVRRAGTPPQNVDTSSPQSANQAMVDQVNELVSGVTQTVSETLTGAADTMQRSGQTLSDTYSKKSKESSKPAGAKKASS